MRRLLSALLISLLSMVSVLGNVSPAAAAYDPILGSGSTWSKNAIDQWKV